VGDEEQERRFQDRIKNPTKRWKLSQMDLESRARWFDYAQAKDEMFAATDTKHAPWYVVNADDKRRARLNCIYHLLGQIPCPYKKINPAALKIPKRQKPTGYVRPPVYTQRFIPEVF
jgi:polyphosphate kinase 2 (PPK2 family)